jgi:hypothetical protein
MEHSSPSRSPSTPEEPELHTTSLRLLLSLLFTAGTFIAPEPAAADAVALQPFKATYAVSYRGMGAGTLQMQLLRDPQTGQYTFETRANPSFLARFAVSRNAIESSVMEITDEGVRPLQWQLDDGKSGKAGDGTLAFDWAEQSVSGEYRGTPVSLQTEAGLQDRQSVQIQVIFDLLRGRNPGELPMVNDDQIKEYAYKRGNSAPVQTKLGSVEAVLFESTRAGSSRVSRVWHAPSLGYVPVRAEQVRKGKVETVMTLIALEQ